jgi:predicted Zn finger-like uncharacterized protein
MSLIGTLQRFATRPAMSEVGEIADNGSQCFTHYRRVLYVRMTEGPPVTRFDCPHCSAQYRLVRVEAQQGLADREITCRSCGAPLQGREGRYALKYFLVGRPRKQAQQGRRR